MMEDRIHVQRVGGNHRLAISSSFDQKNKIFSQHLSSVPSVGRVAVSRRHRSLQIKSQQSSIKEIDPRNVVHISIRSLTNTVCPIDKKLSDINDHSRLVSVPYHRNEGIKSVPNQNSVNSVKTGTQLGNPKEDNGQSSSVQQLNYNLFKNDLSDKNCSSKTDYTASNCQKANYTKPVSIEKYRFGTAPHTLHPDACIDNTSRVHNSTGRVKEKRPLSLHRRNPANERNLESKKRKKCRGGYCCSCGPLGTFFSIVAALLLLSAIAALLIVFIKPSKTSSSGTTSTTTIITTVTTVSTTIASTSSTSTTTATITTTTIRPVIAITRAGDPIIGLYNTSVGQSTGASNGSYSGPSETPDKAIDDNLGTKYLNFGSQGSNGAVLVNPGVGTGFYVTPTISNTSVAIGLLFATANDHSTRDPITVTLEGTNATSTIALNLGSSWTLIYSGPTGIDPITVPARSTYVPQQNFSNTIPYRSYRLLVTSQRNISDATQYGESQILGYA